MIKIKLHMNFTVVVMIKKIAIIWNLQIDHCKAISMLSVNYIYFSVRYYRFDKYRYNVHVPEVAFIKVCGLL